MILILMSPFMIKVDKIVLLLDFLNNLKRRNTGEFPSHCSHELFSRFRPLSRIFQNFDKKSELNLSKRHLHKSSFSFGANFALKTKIAGIYLKFDKNSALKIKKHLQKQFFFFGAKIEIFRRSSGKVGNLSKFKLRVEKNGF